MPRFTRGAADGAAYALLLIIFAIVFFRRYFLSSAMILLFSVSFLYEVALLTPLFDDIFSPPITPYEDA